MRPAKVDPMSERTVSRSSAPISPRAASTAMRAESAVPVGERSTLPGRIATAALLVSSRPSRLTGPAKRQNEKCRQSGLVGW